MKVNLPNPVLCSLVRRFDRRTNSLVNFSVGIVSGWARGRETAWGIGPPWSERTIQRTAINFPTKPPSNFETGEHERASQPPYFPGRAIENKRLPIYFWTLEIWGLSRKPHTRNGSWGWGRSRNGIPRRASEERVVGLT